MATLLCVAAPIVVLGALYVLLATVPLTLRVFKHEATPKTKDEIDKVLAELGRAEYDTTLRRWTVTCVVQLSPWRHREIYSRHLLIRVEDHRVILLARVDPGSLWRFNVGHASDRSNLEARIAAALARATVGARHATAADDSARRRSG